MTRGSSIAALALSVAFAGAAGAATSKAIVVSAGRANIDPSGTATDTINEPLAPVWISECKDGQVVVGVRLIRTKGLTGLSAICSKLRHDGRGYEWASVPTPVKGPKKPPPPKMITRLTSRVMRATIGAYGPDGTYYERVRMSVPVVYEEKIPDPSVPPPPPVVEFIDGKAHDVTCPAGSYVQGVRFTPRAQGGLKQIDLNCAGADGETRLVAALGGEKIGRKRNKDKGAKEPAVTVPAITNVQRIDCRSYNSNPNDGIAVKAIFGTVENGLVQSVGVNCAPAVDRYSVFNALAAIGGRIMGGIERALGIPATFETPATGEGKSVATTCGKDQSCAEQDAQAYCAMEGYAMAAAFELGKKTARAVTPAGEVCEKGSCRAFASITCGGGALASRSG